MTDMNSAHGTAEEQKAKDRLRSTIAFPYSSLREAEIIAEALHRNWGGSATQDQLAGSLGTNPRSGTFRTKLGATRIFGVVTVSRGKVALTDLGHRLADADDKTKKAARVEAFKTVPLFQAVYAEYEGRSLPPDAGLEQKIADLGVSRKQTAKARQALQASAKRAGFFDTTTRRLIEPAVTPSATPKGTESQMDDDLNVLVTDQKPVPLGNLWLTLLDEGDAWSAEKTQDFVDAARRLREVLARS